MAHEITATYKGELFRFEGPNVDTLIGLFVSEGSKSKDEVAKIGLDPDYEFTGKGFLEKGESLRVGQTYRLFGNWRDYHNRRRGEKTKQYAYSEHIEHVPHSQAGLIDYLALHGKGRRVGPAAARKLVEAFGVDEVLHVCQNDLERVQAAVNISADDARGFAAALKEQAEVQDTHVELNNLLGKRGFPKRLPKQLVKQWRNSAAEVIREDPYAMLPFHGVGFSLCDKLYIDLGKDPFDIHRQTMALWYVLTSDRNGNVWHLARKAAQTLSSMIGGGVDAREAILNGKRRAAAGERFGAIATIRTDMEDGGICEDGNTVWIADYHLASQERSIAVNIDRSKLETGELDKLTEYSDRDREEIDYIRHATCARCSRHLTAETVHVLNERPYGPHCITKIPDGHLAEVLPLEDWIEQNPVVHRWIEKQPVGTIYVAEASLWPDPDSIEDIDDHQRQGIADATEDRIGLLTGSPGTGKTFTIAAMIKAAIASGRIGSHQIALAAPTGKAAVRLTQSLQAHGLHLQCRTWHSLLGTKKDASGGWSFDYGAGNPWPFRMIIGDESSMPDCPLSASVMEARGRNCHMLFAGDVNQLAPVGPGAPFRDMIAAELPTGRLTEIKRNDGGIVEACADIRDGRPWAHRYVNNWESSLTITDDRTDDDKRERILELAEQAIADGFDPIWDVQIIVGVNEKSELSRVSLNKTLQTALNRNPEVKGTRFREGDKVVCLKNNEYPRIDKNANVYVANGEIGVVEEIDDTARTMSVRLQYPDRLVRIWFGTDKKEKPGAKDWDLGYAITCHKFQGSEAGRVITVLDKSAKRVCDRSWMTTGLSRATDHQYLVGEAHLAEQFCRYQRVDRRKTFLRERIVLAELNRNLQELAI